MKKFNKLLLELSPLAEEMKKILKEFCSPTNLTNEIMTNVKKLLTPLNQEIIIWKSENKNTVTKDNTVIFGDSIVKRIDVEKKKTKNIEEPRNYATSGEMVKNLYDQHYVVRNH